jgi:putative phage-type endonuclease
MEQGSEEWLQWRREGIGSSDAPVVMGKDPYRSIDDLILDKIGAGEPVQENEAMRLGKKWEPAARAMFFFDHGIDCEPAELTHPGFSYLRASFDGWHDSPLFLEIKFMGQKNFEKVTSEQKPLNHHWIQVQHQFLVAQIAKGFYIPYTLDEQKKRIDQIAYIQVQADHHYIGESLAPALHKFWEVVTQTKKELTNGGTNPADRRTISRNRRMAKNK